MEWLTGGIGFVLGALVIWTLTRLGTIKSGLLGLISVTSIRCIDANTIEIGFEAIPEGDEAICKVLAATYAGGGTAPTPDKCTEVGSISPFQMQVPPGDTRIVVYGVFDCISPAEDVPIPSCSSSSSSGSEGNPQQNILP